MAYTKIPLQWDNVGAEPSILLKTNGFRPGDKPAADTFNYFLNNNGGCISELQTTVGDLNQLTTSDKTSVVGALNSFEKITNAEIDDIFSS